MTFVSLNLPPFFPSIKFISIYINLSYLLSSFVSGFLHDHYHCGRLLGAHGSLVHVIYLAHNALLNY